MCLDSGHGGTLTQSATSYQHINADKAGDNIQHTAMIVTCPTCAAKYRFNAVIRNAILVCHHCGTEFDMSEQNKAAKSNKPSKQKLPLFEQGSKPEPPMLTTVVDDIPVTDTHPNQQTKINPIIPQQEKGQNSISNRPTKTEKDDELIMPKRQKTHIWTWLVCILLLIAASGFWQYRSTWVHQTWIQSSIILLDKYIELPVDETVLRGNWYISQQDLSLEWITRQDKSKALLISGRIMNHLPIDMPPPSLHIRYSDESGAYPLPVHISMPITEPPTLAALQHAPFVAPTVDNITIKANGQRDFIIVLEDVPEQAAQIMVSTLSGNL